MESRRIGKKGGEVNVSDKQSLILDPPAAYSCPYCSYWCRYPPGKHIKNPSWGKCTFESVPKYMEETHESRGCNKHSLILYEKQQKRYGIHTEPEQLAFF